MKPPQACSLKTRMNFILPDLPDVGVWRLDTGSIRATGSILGKLRLMELARDQGVYLPAWVWIDHQVEVHNGQTSRFPVIVVELMATFREVATGQLAERGWAGQLPPAPGEMRLAITAPQPAVAPASTATPDPATAEPGTPAWENLKAQDKAQRIADLAAAATARADVTSLWDQAEADGLADDHICVDRAEDVWEELRLNLQARWRSLPPEAAAG